MPNPPAPSAAAVALAGAKDEMTPLERGLIAFIEEHGNREVVSMDAMTAALGQVRMVLIYGFLGIGVFGIVLVAALLRVGVSVEGPGGVKLSTSTPPAVVERSP